MFLRSILDILWARRVIVLTATASCLVGGGYVALTGAPRYQASARVILEYIKPNPVTGAFVSNKMVAAYVTTQMRVIRDYQVAIPTADALGMLDNIDLQTAFSSIPGADPGDYPKWVAGRIIDNTGVQTVQDSNILKITNVASTPEGALATVEALRAAYIESTLEGLRSGARAGVVRLTAQADQAVADIARLEGAKASLEKQTGVMASVESNRLSDMVTARRSPVIQESIRVLSAGRLTEAEAEVAEATKTLGPNNPKLKALRTVRDLAKVQVDQERALAASGGQFAANLERARQAAIDAQKDKVLSQRQTQLELRLLQDEINGRQETLNALNTQIAKLRQLTSLQASSLTPFGAAEADPQPVFPNPWLIFGGAGILGAAIGSLLALFVELLQRRARHVRDVELSVGAPLLGVVPILAEVASRKKLRVRYGDPSAGGTPKRRAAA